MFIIRQEEPADVRAIGALLEAAFKDHPHSNQTEHLLLEALREAGALVTSLVAIENGAVTGCAAFSPVTINGAECRWLGLGPVAVRPDRQRRGAGAALIASGLDKARNSGARGCVVLGDPAYYRRFGFQADSRLVLDGVPAEYFLAQPFGGAAPVGKVEYHPAFALCG